MNPVCYHCRTYTYGIIGARIGGMQVYYCPSCLTLYVQPYVYKRAKTGRLRCNTPSVQETLRARCNKCKTEFPFVPKKLNSTKNGDIYPRCPKCGTYRETVVINE